MIDLFLIPFAGGTSLLYSEWEFSSNINPIALDYKGHGLRMKEPLYFTFEEMVDDIVDQIVKNTNSGNSIMIFGHSMGGLVSWDAVKKLINMGFNVKQLIVSSCVPPHCFNERLYDEMATDEWLSEFLLKFSRISSTRMESGYFKKYIYPAILNDYRLISVHKHEEIDLVPVNIACFFGEQDELMPNKWMDIWREYTYGEFKLRSFSGDHFYLENEDNRKEIVSTIESLV